LRCIDDARFTATVGPDQLCRYKLSWSDGEGGTCLVRVRITSGEERVARLKLRARLLADAETGRGAP
jgi:hypothetical protein